MLTRSFLIVAVLLVTIVVSACSTGAGGNYTAVPRHAKTATPLDTARD